MVQEQLSFVLATDKTMDRLMYFFNKLWTFVTTIHLLTYLTLFIVLGLLFFYYQADNSKIQTADKKVKCGCSCSHNFYSITCYRTHSIIH
jgi:hypothetical protein